MEPTNRNLELRGARQNNLNGVDIDLPLGKTVVITGPSGSGKSSLAFETVYAEGQRRYMQSLSTYARQFMEKFSAPDVDRIRNIPPTVALEQINPVRNSRATVGTSTELYDYLRLLFGKVGVEYSHGLPMERLSFTEIFDRIVKKHRGQPVVVAFQYKLPRNKGATQEVLEEFLRSGFTRLIHRKKVLRMEEAAKEGKGRAGTVAIVVDRVRVEPEDEGVQTRLTESIRTAMGLGEGLAAIYVEEEGKFEMAGDYTTLNRCRKTGELRPPRSAVSFSFNNPVGACPDCKGFGNTLEVDPDLAIPDPRKSVSQGAVEPFTKPSLNYWQKQLLIFCQQHRIDRDLPFRELPKNHRKWIFDGHGDFPGVRGVFEELDREKYKMRIRVFVSRYKSAVPCRSCNGKRLNPDALNVKIGGKDIADICNLSLDDCATFFREHKFSKRDATVAADILAQIHRRLEVLATVGVGYLTLSRLTRTLSGGEYQRILLATQLSQGLTDTLYVLDEPSIGLHPKDTDQLMAVLDRLKSTGNTLLVVEHDPEIIKWAEHVVDMGPGSGRLGGDVVFSGSQERFQVSDCPTAKALRDWEGECARTRAPEFKPDQVPWLEVVGASENNLQNVSVKIPLKTLVAITGVSGSGKSTLIVDTVFQALAKMFLGRSEKIGRFKSIKGFEHLAAVELVDQSPIGKSSRSNPITFLKGYDEIRSLFASTRDAAKARLTPGHFSFNVAGGRCDQCEGEGRVRIDMVFMEDVWIPCEACEGKRFKPHVLEIRFRGKNINEVLALTVEEAFSFFEGCPNIRSRLALLTEVGLGYLQLGQPSYTLSGGEAQRLKIARELSRGMAKKLPTLFILDEPTTGLHFREIQKLIHVLRRLVKQGHSVVVIEHNVQLICAAQYLIDLGPDGGEGGGHVVVVGTPAEVAKKKLAHTGRYLAEILDAP